jgi:prepilin-type N-terminal cleavage/methylation domain-containing protein
MPTYSVGRTSKRGVTLIEMTVVVTIMGLIIAVSAPSLSAGLDSVRIATAADNIASFLNAAVNRAERRQEPMELIISPKEARLALFSDQPGFERELKLPEGVSIEAVLPDTPGDAEGVRHLLLLPGASVPGIAIRIVNGRGARRQVRLDPMTGFPRIESVITE